MSNNTSASNNTLQLVALELLEESENKDRYRIGFEFDGKIKDARGEIDIFNDISGEFYTQIVIEH